MKYRQGDIVEVNFLFPNGGSKPHMAIIVSNDSLQEDDEVIYLVLISSKAYHPQHCISIDNDMVSVSFSKKSYVVCHLIAGYTERDIVRRIGTIKSPFLQEIIRQIIRSLF
jgi:hypothetical protein